VVQTNCVLDVWSSLRANGKNLTKPTKSAVYECQHWYYDRGVSRIYAGLDELVHEEQARAVSNIYSRTQAMNPKLLL
jgi:hypothetical protein